MQLFGLCDVSIKLMLSGCWQVILCGVFEFCWFVCFSEQSLFVGLFVCLFVLAVLYLFSNPNISDVCLCHSTADLDFGLSDF